MATTVASIIETARDAHPLFGERNISPGAAVRMIDKIHKRLYVKIANKNPSMLATRASAQAFANSTAAAGYTITAGYIKIVEIYLAYTDGSRLPLNIVDSVDKGNIHVHPSAFIENGKLYPIDPVYDEWSDSTARTGWNTCDNIYVVYVAGPTSITQQKASGSGITIQTPDSSADFLSAALALRFAVRLADKVSRRQMDWMTRDYQDARDTFMELVENEAAGEIRHVQIVD
jgi:hypothetical protein